MSQSLVEKAKLVSDKRKPKEYPQNECELAVSWMRSEVTSYQVCRATGVKNQNMYAWLASRLRYASTLGLI